MDDRFYTNTTGLDLSTSSDYSPSPNEAGLGLDAKTIAKHGGLFLLTVATVALAGSTFVGYDPSLFPAGLPNIPDFFRGLLFAGLLLSFLGVHEFGHYFAAVYHRVKVTLPYFIPIPLGIGTMGAVIRIKQKINDTVKLFDVGVSGPLAGFLVSISVLLYGFATLPDPSFINHFHGHQAIKAFVSQYGHYPSAPLSGSNGQLLTVGPTLLYSFFASFFANVPPMWEMYHYPFLFAGWLGLFFTALNLMPIGQLDGGHILYSLIGFKKHRIVARVFFTVLVILAGIQVVPFIHALLGRWDVAYGLLSWGIWACVLLLLFFKAFRKDWEWIIPAFAAALTVTAAYTYLIIGNIAASGSLIWVVWSFFIAYIVKVEHPPALNERELDSTRKILGWLSMVIFVLCISPNPLYIS